MAETRQKFIFLSLGSLEVLQSRADNDSLLLKHLGSFPLISSPARGCGPPPHHPIWWHLHSRQQDRRNKKEGQRSTRVISSGSPVLCLNTCAHNALDETQSDCIQLQACLGNSIFILSSHIPSLNFYYCGREREQLLGDVQQFLHKPSGQECRRKQSKNERREEVEEFKACGIFQKSFQDQVDQLSLEFCGSLS